jgi:hypothetical protein
MQAPFWEDPRTIGINRRKCHTPSSSFSCRNEAIQSHVADMQKLSGYRHRAPPLDVDTRTNGSRQLLSSCSWRFKLFENPEAVPADFFEPSFDESGFAEVRCVTNSQDCQQSLLR